MKDNQKIAKYLVAFNRLAAEVQWDANALCYAFYRGLPDRIKDQISNVGKPDNLLDLRTLAQNIDFRYWERQSEINRTTKKNPPSNKPGPSKPTPAPSKSNPSKSGSSSGSSGASGSSSTSTSSTKPKPDISHLLDGRKLTEAERQCRIKNNLCIYCRIAGYTA